MFYAFPRSFLAACDDIIIYEGIGSSSLLGILLCYY